MKFLAYAIQSILLLSKGSDIYAVGSEALPEPLNENAEIKTFRIKKISNIDKSMVVKKESSNEGANDENDEDIEMIKSSISYTRRLGELSECRNIKINKYGIKYKVNPVKKGHDFISVTIDIGFEASYTPVADYPPYTLYDIRPYKDFNSKNKSKRRIAMYMRSFCFKQQLCKQNMGHFDYKWSKDGISDPIFGAVLVSAWECQDGLKGLGMFTDKQYKNANRKQKRKSFVPDPDCVTSTMMPSEINSDVGGFEFPESLVNTDPAPAPAPHHGRLLGGNNKYYNIKISDEGISYKFNPPNKDGGWIDVWIEIAALGETTDFATPKIMAQFSLRARTSNYVLLNPAADYLSRLVLDDIPVYTNQGDYVECTQVAKKFEYKYDDHVNVRTYGIGFVTAWCCEDGTKGLGTFSEPAYYDARRRM